MQEPEPTIVAPGLTDAPPGNDPVAQEIKLLKTIFHIYNAAAKHESDKDLEEDLVTSDDNDCTTDQPSPCSTPSPIPTRSTTPLLKEKLFCATPRCSDLTHFRQGIFAPGHHSEKDKDLLELLSHLLFIAFTTPLPDQENMYKCINCIITEYDNPKNYQDMIQHIKDQHGNNLGRLELTRMLPNIDWYMKSALIHRKMISPSPLTYKCNVCNLNFKLHLNSPFMHTYATLHQTDRLNSVQIV
jgi:hypothetical protein